MTDFLDRLGPLALPLTVFIAIEAAAAPRDVFTERGWRYRLWALKLQAVALVWVLLMPLLF